MELLTSAGQGEGGYAKCGQKQIRRRHGVKILFCRRPLQKVPCALSVLIHIKLEMWANAQPDGCPAEHRWRPLFHAAKFDSCPLLDVVQERCQDAKPVEICRGTPNWSTDLSR